MSNEPRMVKTVVIGEAGVGKTCFGDQFTHGQHFIIYHLGVAPFGHFSRIKPPISIGGIAYRPGLEDVSLTPIRNRSQNLVEAWSKSICADADAFVLLYDVTSRESFEHVTSFGYRYIWSCRRTEREDGKKYPSGRQRFGCVLVGNKIDRVEGGLAERKVPADLAEQWAQSQGIRHVEVSSNVTAQVVAAMELLVRQVVKAEKRDAEAMDAELMVAAEPAKGKKNRLKTLIKTRIMRKPRRS